MKKFLVLALVLVPCLSVVAGGGIEGYTADVDVTRDVDKQDDFKASSTDVELRGGPIFEGPFKRWPEKDLRPYALIGLERDRDPDSFSGIPDERNQFYFGLGATAIYPVHQNRVNIGMGPQLESTLWLKETGASAFVYDSYFELQVSLALLVTMEMQLKKCWWFFAGVEVASLDFDNWTREFGGVKYTDRTLSFDSDVVGFNPRLGFTYRPEQK